MSVSGRKAVFAGGCFWCMVQPFDEMPGIIKVVSGYTGGHTGNPSYEEVKSGTSGHYEAVEITYDPGQFPYEKLLELYWQQIDPTDDGGQFFDRGPQYRTAIFYHDSEQRQAAGESLKQLQKSGKFTKPVVTEVLPATRFYPAEAYHQDFYKKNPLQYKQEKRDSGRETFIKENWS